MKWKMLLILLSSKIAFASAKPPLKVTIDPGHGGSDAGAVRGKAREADIALQVSRHLRELLRADTGFQAELTRTADQNLSLQERVKISEAQKSNLFISIHANASSDPRAKGVEFFFQNHLPPDEETLYLASVENSNSSQADSSSELDPTKKNDLSAIIEDLRRQDRMRSSHRLSRKLLEVWSLSSPVESNALRQAPFYVVAKSHIPSVLIELGFLTHPKEAERLINSKYQQELAQRIYKGLKSYKEFMDNLSTHPLQ